MTVAYSLYLPDLSSARFVRQYAFRHPDLGPSSCVLVTDCQSPSPIQYVHVMYVYEHGDFLTGKICLAVSSEVNRMATPGSGRSHFLCIFSGAKHINLGPSDDWADLEKFTAKALEVISGQYSLEKSPEEIPVPAIMLEKFQPPRPQIASDNPAPAKVQAKKWWQFWK
jgi:hypothetical protein